MIAIFTVALLYVVFAQPTLKDVQSVSAIIASLVAGGIILMAVVAAAVWVAVKRMRDSWFGFIGDSKEFRLLIMTIVADWAASNSFGRAVDVSREDAIDLLRAEIHEEIMKARLDDIEKRLP